MKRFISDLLSQFESMVVSGKIPVFEFEIINDDYLVVNLSANEKGMFFSFDEMEKPTFFSGDIIKHGNSYLLHWCEYSENLDQYLEQIHDEISEGFLIPNNLYSEDV